MFVKKGFLAKEVLIEHFGQVVGDVGSCLINNGASSLKEITKITKWKSNQVKKSLCVLIQHNLASFFAVPGINVAKYQANVDNMVLIASYPKLIFISRDLYGEEAELIIEKLLQNGMMKLTPLFKIVMELVGDSDEDQNKLFIRVYSAFKNLLKYKFIRRKEKLVENENTFIPVFYTDQSSFIVPTISLEDVINFTKEDEEVEVKSKKPRMSDEVKDLDYWAVNEERFRLHIRDQIIVSSVRSRHGENSAAIVNAMLQISQLHFSPTKDETQCITIQEIHHIVNRTIQITFRDIKEYLIIMKDDEKRIVVSGEYGSEETSFCINFKNALKAIVETHVLSYVQQRFGNKSGRVIRVLLKKGNLEQKQIEDLVMIPGKFCKELVYKMMVNEVITLNEISRNIGRKLFVYGVDLPNISRGLLERSLMACGNKILIRQNIHNTNKRLIEKQEKVESIKEKIDENDEDAIREVEDTITPSELNQLRKIKDQVDKTFEAQINYFDCVIMFEYYLELIKPIHRLIEKK